MRVKALWSREYAQARLFAWAVPIVYFLTLGLVRMNTWLFSDLTSVNARLAAIGQEANPVLAAYGTGSFGSMGRAWLALGFFVLALVQIGVERRNGSQEQLFALPFSRRQIYMHKWMFGAALLTVSVVLNHLIDMAVVASSPISPYFSLSYHLSEMGYTWLLLAAVYTLALFIGTFTGTVAAQTGLSFLALMFPPAFTLILRESLEIQGYDLSVRAGDPVQPGTLDRWTDRLNAAAYIAIPHEELSWTLAAGLLILLALSLWLGVLSYERNRTERNGKLVIFNGWERFIRGVFIVCASMVAGLFAANALDLDRRIAYDIGLVAGFAIFWWILRMAERVWRRA